MVLAWKQQRTYLKDWAPIEIVNSAKITLSKCCWKYSLSRPWIQTHTCPWEGPLFFAKRKKSCGLLVLEKAPCFTRNVKNVAGGGSLRGTAACTYESIKEINGQLGCRLGKQASRAADEQELGQRYCCCTYRAVRTESTETDLDRMNRDSNFDSESENRFLKNFCVRKSDEFLEKRKRQVANRKLSRSTKFDLAGSCGLVGRGWALLPADKAVADAGTVLKVAIGVSSKIPTFWNSVGINSYSKF